MASTIQVDNIKDIGGNTIISSNGSGTFTSNLPASAPNVSTATGTLPIANGGTGGTSFSAAGLANTPAFHVYKSGNQSISTNTATNLTWQNEFYDTDSAFASNKFTVPSGKGGTYMFFWLLKTGSMGDTKSVQGWLQKNGSDLDSQMSRSKQYIPTANEIHLTGHYTDVAVAGDYYEMRVFQDNGGAVNILAETSSFWGFKLIGA
jgi:hypothetical protein